MTASLHMIDPSMPPALSVDRLTRRFAIGGGLFRRASRVLTAVDDVSFSVGAGETLGIVGESGCGKTTLARMLVGVLKPSSGRIRLDDTVVADDGISAKPGHDHRVQMVFQNPFASLDPRLPIWQTVVEPLVCGKRKRLSRGELRARAAAVLTQVGLGESEIDKLPRGLSGGQRQRVAVARALIAEPSCIVLDEPTSALDVSVQAQVINLLQRIRRERQVTYLMISHNLSVIYHFADRVAVMYLGRIVELGSRDEVMLRPSHPYTQLLLRAAPRLDQIGYRYERIAGAPPDNMVLHRGCAFADRCDFATEICRTERPELRVRQPNSAMAACHHA